MIEHLVGMQAQNPHDPYFALWSRIDGFRPAELSDLVAKADRRSGSSCCDRRSTWSRPGTAWRSDPIFGSVLARTFGSTVLLPRTSTGVDLEASSREARALLEERPRTRAELGPLLADRWPDRVPGSLAQAATYLLPVVQVHTAGNLAAERPGRLDHDRELAGPPARSARARPTSLIIRYLAAFGPAAQKDMRVWSGLAGLSRGGRRGCGRGCAPSETRRAWSCSICLMRPGPTRTLPAPPRFLPEYDNLLLSHSDRSRFFERQVFPKGWVGNLLVDGIFAGSWKIKRTKDTR